VVGSPSPLRALQQGVPGEIGIPISSVGQGAATGLVATVNLPDGLTVRAGGSDDPDEWKCTGSGATATCRVTTLPPGESGTIRVKLFVAWDAAGGTLSGWVTATDSVGTALTEAIPASPVTVRPF
jgi:hypothetical protein